MLGMEIPHITNYSKKKFTRDASVVDPAALRESHYRYEMIENECELWLPYTNEDGYGSETACPFTGE